MAREIMYPPLVSRKSLLKGILGGSLLVGGLANPYGPIIQAVLFLFGLFILIDGVMVTGKGVFIVLCLIAAVVFGVLTLVLSVTILGAPYLIIIFIIAFFMYLGRFLKPIRKLLYAKENVPEKTEKENQE
jgi:hypothetical protein